jgi:hypothetical protein
MSIGVTPGVKAKKAHQNNKPVVKTKGAARSESGALAVARVLGAGHPDLAPPLATKYCFTLQAIIDQQFVGETPGGFRIDLAYSAADPSVEIEDSVLTPPLLDFIEGATLLSGTDWVSVSRAGIVDFDSRVTLSLDTSGLGKEDRPEEPCLISAKLRGRGDLRYAQDSGGNPVFGPHDDSNKVISVWRNGFPTGSFLHVTLGITVDVPIEGFDQKQTAVFEECRRLGSSLLLGRAKVTFNKAAFGAVNGIELDVYGP